VVSISPAASRFVLALGAASTLVGVDPVSRRIPALGGLPIVDLVGAAELVPDLVLAPALTRREAELADSLRELGVEVVEFAPHDFDDAFALCRGLGSRLVGPARAQRFESALARELARIGGASYGRLRPRVAAVVDIDPITLAGGHSFGSDLIEIAGATSVSHGGEDLERVVTLEQLSALDPDLLLFVSETALPSSRRREAREALPAALPLEFFVFDAGLLWMVESADAARQLRALVEPFARDALAAPSAAR